MENIPDFKKTDFSSFLSSPVSASRSSLLDVDLDEEDVETERTFRQQKKAFREEVKALLDDKEDGDINWLALKLGSAWAKYECDQIISGKQKKLSSVETITETYDSLRQRHKRLAEIIKKIFGHNRVALSSQEETFLVSHLKLDADDFKRFIMTCALYDKCFYNQNKLVIQTAMDEFKKDIPFFMDWIGQENKFLINNKKDQEPNKNMDHILHNFVFAEAVLKNIPPETWTCDVVNALGTWVVNKDGTLPFIREFARKLEKCPTDKIKDYFDVLSELSSVGPDMLNGFSYKGLLTLFSHLKEDKAIQEAKAFYEAYGAEIMKKEIKNLTNEEWEKLAKFLSKTSVGIEQLIDASMNSSNPLIWRLYSKGILDKSDVQRILKFAIKKDRRDFLMMQKPVHFSNEFPCYEELKAFLKDKSSAQGVRFLKSFSWNGVSVEAKCKILNDFISSKAINFHFAQKLNLFHHWANSNSGHEILSYCYGKNVDTDPVLRIPVLTLRKLFLTQDEKGKTPWHYICQNRDKSFFSRRLKELSNSFIEACLIPDKEDKTPLAYASSDSKFIKKISEKNPEIGRKLAQAGISTEYVPNKKITTPVVEKTQPVKLAPAVPSEKKPVISDLEQQKRIEKAIEYAVQNHQNLIIKGTSRVLGFSNAVLREIQSDEVFKQDIFEHLQQFVSTPFGQNFVGGNATHWKVFEGADGVYEMSISPKNCHSHSMPRIYFRKFLFKKTDNNYAITNRKETDLPQSIWVAVKKGDKKTQSKDGKKALAVRFKNDGLQVSGPVNFNDLSWHCLDMNPPLFQRTISPLPQNGGR